MSENVRVEFEGSDRVEYVTPAKARQMTKAKKNRHGKIIPADASVVSKSPFTIRVAKVARHRYPATVNWSSSSDGHVMMGAGLMNCVVPLAERGSNDGKKRAYR